MIGSENFTEHLCSLLYWFFSEILKVSFQISINCEFLNPNFKVGLHLVTHGIAKGSM